MKTRFKIAWLQSDWLRWSKTCWLHILSVLSTDYFFNWWCLFAVCCISEAANNVVYKSDFQTLISVYFWHKRHVRLHMHHHTVCITTESDCICSETVFLPGLPAPPAPRVTSAASSLRHIAACAWQIQPLCNGATQSFNGTGDSHGVFRPHFFAQLTVNPKKALHFRSRVRNLLHL